MSVFIALFLQRKNLNLLGLNGRSIVWLNVIDPTIKILILLILCQDPITFSFPDSHFV